jgi:hypothetical protein
LQVIELKLFIDVTGWERSPALAADGRPYKIVIRVQFKRRESLGSARAGILAIDSNPPLADLEELVRESLGAVRNIALLLRPSMLDDLGLVPALQWQGREVSKRTGLRARITATNTAFLREG